jgi:stage II sporulation protein D
MSQWGAKGMAERGYKAERILEYYYPGTTLGWIGARAR